MSIGTPLNASATRVLLLGSGELGKEVAIELMRLGAEVIACDRYEGAPAMQVAHRSHVLDMLDGDALERVIKLERPALIVPEIEAIATDRLVRLEGEGWRVIPTAAAAFLTMNREGIRRLAAEELGLATTPYAFASTYDELHLAALHIGLPVVIKPIMSSSGKGQSVARTEADLRRSWDYAQSGGRAGQGRVIIEGFVKFVSEITLLTLRTVNGTQFCDAIGHLQVDGDYIESWQPHALSALQLQRSKAIAGAITERLGGYGIFGVELFLLEDDQVLFSEVSPRPHDTGLVTMATQVLSEFALHARAILGLPVASIERHSCGASAAIKATTACASPVFHGLTKVLSVPGVDVRLFGKPEATAGRRMGVVTATAESVDAARAKAVAGRAALSMQST